MGTMGGGVGRRVMRVGAGMGVSLVRVGVVVPVDHSGVDRKGAGPVDGSGLLSMKMVR